MAYYRVWKVTDIDAIDRNQWWVSHTERQWGGSWVWRDTHGGLSQALPNWQDCEDDDVWDYHVASHWQDKAIGHEGW